MASLGVLCSEATHAAKSATASEPSSKLAGTPLCLGEMTAAARDSRFQTCQTCIVYRVSSFCFSSHARLCLSFASTSPVCIMQSRHTTLKPLEPTDKWQTSGHQFIDQVPESFFKFSGCWKIQNPLLLLTE